MVERNTFTTVADGDQLNEGYFNDIYKNRLKLITSNTSVGVSISEGLGGTTTDDTTTLTVGAGVVQEFIDVRIQGELSVGSGNTSSNTASITTDIASTDIDSWVLSETLQSRQLIKGDSHSFIYEPSESEKTNGFTLTFTASASNSTSDGNAAVDINKIWVMGV